MLLTEQPNLGDWWSDTTGVFNTIIRGITGEDRLRVETTGQVDIARAKFEQERERSEVWAKQLPKIIFGLGAVAALGLGGWLLLKKKKTVS